MTRNLRHNKILDIISNRDVETQEELTQLLLEEGYKVTQATISRDIKELGLIKVVGDNKKSKYAYVDQADNNVSNKLLSLFKHSVISIKSSLNIIVIRTILGSANSAAAMVDKLNLDSIIGSVAGDDTILIVVRNVDEVQEVVDKFNLLLK